MKSITLLTIAFVISSSAAMAQYFSEPASVVEIGPRKTHFSESELSPSMLQMLRENLHQQIQECIEPCSLSQKSSILVEYVADGHYPKFLSANQADNPVDVFYARQAIWDCCPLHISNPGSIRFDSTATSTHCCITSIPTTGDRPAGTVVLLHAIPQSVVHRRAGIFTDKDVHDPHNLILIPTEKLDSDRFLSFQKERIDKITSPAWQTKADLLKQRELLLSKYKDLIAPH